MKIYVTGAGGQLGQALVNLGCIPFKADVTNFDEVRQEMLETLPDVLIHCAGLSVDGSMEQYERGVKLAIRGTGNVMDDQLYPNVHCILISSSHVFDGKRGKYTEKDKPNPINDYGHLKFAAEQVTRMSGGKIIRLSTCFNSEHKDIKFWREMGENGLGFEVPTFIRRTYVHVNHAAEGIMFFANRWMLMPEIVNISGTEDLSMYEFALTVASHYGFDKNLIEPRKKEVQLMGQDKRPYRAGLNIKLAKRLGIPLYSVYEGMKIL